MDEWPGLSGGRVLNRATFRRLAGRRLADLSSCICSPIHHTYYRPTDNLCGSGSDTDSKSDAGNACGNSETNWNTAGRDDDWVCGRLRRSTRIRMLQNIKNTICRDTGGADMEIWVEDSLTMRHIRLALEDNCTSCTRHPNLTIDGGAHSLTPALETDFATCCL